ncbi:MAG: NAD(P)H-quinone oxidoreductase [Cyanobacteria bacterium QS_8_64_29]|nr:MAG: NAD(P)H-quinone oxidoreductase [Cyanobacteria bacterium QS_8_64_29]
MPLLTAGKAFLRDLEREGTLGVYTPLEGGYEGRYQRRLRAAGYHSLHLSAKSLGDLPSYLTDTHGVRPPFLGKKNIGREAAVGDIYYVPPIVQTQLDALPANSKGLLLWLIEGFILSRLEWDYLCKLPQREPRVRVVVEIGGDRAFRWVPLREQLAAPAS